MATLFTITFEDGTTDEFDGTAGPGLSVIAPGLVASNYCMAVNITDVTARYGQVTAASDKDQVRAFFAFDPRTLDPLVMADGDIFSMLIFRDSGGTSVFRTELGYDATTGFRVRPRARVDSDTWADGAWINISANEHFVEVKWNASSAPGADDGSVEMWVDVYGDDLGDPFGAADSSATGIDNDVRLARRFELGARGIIDIGTSGTLWLDRLVVNDDGTEIGHPGTLAFPRAQGAGRFSVGGREGTVYIVSNLNNTGAGSLREVCEASGARIAVFTIDGDIQATSNITIDDPYISIFGQTAPGDGICLRDYTLRIRTHDVIIQHIRSRPGDTSAVNPDDLDAVSIAQAPASETDVDNMAFNIILDHCSLSWSIDELLEFWNAQPTRSMMKNITLQWCIFAEALADAGHTDGIHSRAVIMSGIGTDIAIKNVSLHHSLFAHNRTRNPLVAAASCIEVINNVMHDCPGYVCVLGDSDNEVNYVGNTTGDQSVDYTLLVEPNVDTEDPGDYCDHQVYVADNTGNYYVDDAFQIVGKGWGASDPASAAQRTAWESATAIYIANSQLMAEARITAYEKVLRCAGCWPHDTVDARVAQAVRDNDTGIIDSQTEVGGWPTLTGGSAGTDTDSDGMPDDWETAHGTNPNVADDDGYDVDPMGWWTSIEVFAFTCTERCRKGAISGIMGG